MSGEVLQSPLKFFLIDVIIGLLFMAYLVIKKICVNWLKKFRQNNIMIPK